MIKQILKALLKLFLNSKENTPEKFTELRNIVIIRQHNQLGDLLACSSLFRAIKEKFPRAAVTVVVSPENKGAVLRNKYIDEVFVFEKKRILHPSYLKNLFVTLRRGYDLAVVPCTVSISFTSNILARLSKSKKRIGVKELNGMKNDFDFFFNYRISMDWRSFPDSNVADFCLEILRPFGIDINDKKPEVSLNDNDCSSGKYFVEKNFTPGKLIVGIHPGAGKPNNRWSVKKFIELAERIKKNFDTEFYMTGTTADKEITDYFIENISFKVVKIIDKDIPQVAAIISLSDLIITNDTGLMHVAGSTGTPQVSIFGPTNPFNWAPCGANKYFLHKSDLIDDITVDDVFVLCESILKQKEKLNASGISGRN